MKKLVAFVAGLMVAPLVAQAQSFPSKPITIVSAFAPGGTIDFLGRLMMHRVGENTGWRFVLESKAGANGHIGTEYAAKAAPDGYTLIIGSPGPMVVAAILNPKLPYQPQKDFAPVTMGTQISNLLVVSPTLPVNSVADLIAMAKAQPGKLTYASSGVGSSLHLAGELLKLLAKVDILHVPYKGTAPAVADVVGGQTSMLFSDPSALPLVKAGKLRALAQSTAKRSASMPDVPTVAESGLPGFEVVNWYAFFAPAGTPEPVVARLNAELVKALNSPDVKSRLIGAGQDPSPGTPQQLGTLLKDDIALWTRVVQAAKITLD